MKIIHDKNKVWFLFSKNMASAKALSSFYLDDRINYIFCLCKNLAIFEYICNVFRFLRLFIYRLIIVVLFIF